MMVAVPETHHDGGLRLDELLRELPAGTRLLGDGSVRFVKESIDLATWRGLATIAGGEVWSGDAY